MKFGAFDRLQLIALALLWCAPAVAQKPSGSFSKVYVGADGLAHVVARDGADHSIAAEPKQVSVISPALSPDGRIAGWLVEEPDCCTSYPIATRLVLHSGTAHRVLSDGLMVYSWCFVPGIASVAVSSGTVHGMQGQNLTLYGTRSGRQLKNWTGDDDAKPPAWAACLGKLAP